MDVKQITVWWTMDTVLRQETGHHDQTLADNQLPSQTSFDDTLNCMLFMR